MVRKPPQFGRVGGLGGWGSWKKWTRGQLSRLMPLLLQGMHALRTLPPSPTLFPLVRTVFLCYPPPFLPTTEDEDCAV